MRSTGLLAGLPLRGAEDGRSDGTPPPAPPPLAANTKVTAWKGTVSHFALTYSINLKEVKHTYQAVSPFALRGLRPGGGADQVRAGEL